MPNKDSRVCNLHFVDRSSSRTGSIFFINTDECFLLLTLDSKDHI